MRIKFSGMQIGIFVAAIALIAIATYYFSLPRHSNPNASSLNGQQIVAVTTGNTVGNRAPDFTLTTVDGKNLTLAYFKATGKPTVFYFWATWCPFCRDELTRLKSIYPQYQDKVNFVAVDVDVEESAQTITNEVNLRGYLGTYTLANVPMLEAYKVYNTATKYVIASNGTIIYFSPGEITSDQWIQLFNQAISS